jgi:hypothetical protein
MVSMSPRLLTWLVTPPPKNKRNQVAFFPPMMDPVRKFSVAAAFTTDRVAGAAVGLSCASADGLIVSGIGADFQHQVSVFSLKLLASAWSSNRKPSLLQANGGLMSSLMIMMIPPSLAPP